MIERAYFAMFFKLWRSNIKTEAKVTDIQAFQVMIINRIGTEIPSISYKLSKLDPINRFEFSDLLMDLKLTIAHPLVRIIVGMELFSWLFWCNIIYFLFCWSYFTIRNPIIVSFVKIFEMDIVNKRILILLFGNIIV